MSGTVDRLRLEQEVITSLCNAQPAAYRSDSDAPILQEVLATYNSDSLHRLITAARNGLGETLLATLTHNAPDEALVIDLLALQSFPESDRNMSNLFPFLNSMSLYEHLTPLRDGNYAAREAQLRALFLVTDHLYSTEHVKHEFDLQGESKAYLRDQKLRDLLTRHYAPELVARTVIERGITDVAILVAVLDSMDGTAPAVLDGVL